MLLSKDYYRYLKRITLFLGILLAAIITYFTIMKMGVLNPEVKVELRAKNNFEKSLSVVGAINYPPYTYLDKDKTLQGYEIELMNALGNKLGYNIDFKLMRWEEAIASLNKGEALVISGKDIMLNAEDDNFATTVPTSIDSFTYFGRDGLASIYDAWDKRIGITDDIPKSFLKNSPDNLRKFSKVSLAFAALDQGELDYVIARVSVGRRYEEQYPAIYNCVRKGPTYTSYIGFAALKKNSAVIEELNAAIKLLEKDGTIGRLQKKWMYDYYQHYSLTQVIKENLTTYLGFLLAIVVYLCFIVAGFLLQKQNQQELNRQELEKQTMRQQLELKNMETQLLLAQIQPHFMFNVLNTISALCDLNPPRARDMTINFAKYLRENLQALHSRELVEVSKEITHAEYYIRIEMERFRDKLDYELDLDCTDFKLPAFTIQPLVENAIKHGIRGQDKPGVVSIATRELEKDYEVVIKDNGVGFEVEAVNWEDGTHIGIANVRARLKHFCQAVLQLESKPGLGTTATIYIPKNRPGDRF